MVMKPDPRHDPAHLAEAARHALDEGRVLLDRLEQNRRASDARRAETGALDPLRVITGATSLDGAIMSTRAMLRELDQLIGEIEGGPRRGQPRTAPDDRRSAGPRPDAVPSIPRTDPAVAAVQSAAIR